MTPISANSGEYRSVVGLKDLYIAEVTQDDSAAYVADAPEALAPAASASQKPTVNAKTQYADDAPFDAMTSEGETVVELEVTALPIEMLAKITGKIFDAVSGRLFDNGGTPPYCALMFKSQKSNGNYRYYSFLKGRFSTPEEEMATKTDSPDPKSIKLTFTAIKTVYQFDLGDINDGVKRVVGDDDTTNFSGTTWFSQVQTPAAASPSALSLSSSVPADDATGVSKTNNLTLTYNNALVAGVVNSVTLLDDAQAVVAATITLDATKKIITIDPTASLDGSTAHTIVANVTDIYGQSLTSIITFTTAA